MIECTCLNCGWVHIATTREEAEKQARKFMEFYNAQNFEVQGQYGRTSFDSLMCEYGRCFFCGQTDTTNYRESRDGDCPVGCTIQPTIWDRDD